MKESYQNGQSAEPAGKKQDGVKTWMRVVLVCALVVAVLWVWAMSGHKEHLVWVSGMVVVGTDDGLKQGLSASLAVEEEDGVIAYYEIVNDRKGRELLAHSNSLVSLRGSIGQDEDGVRWVRVRQWQLGAAGAETPPATSRPLPPGRG